MLIFFPLKVGVFKRAFLKHLLSRQKDEQSSGKYIYAVSLSMKSLREMAFHRPNIVAKIHGFFTDQAVMMQQICMFIQPAQCYKP